MARRSTGLQFAIHFRARQTDHAHRFAKVSRLRKPFENISGFGDLGSPAFNNFVIVRLARFGGRHRLPTPISDRIRGRRAPAYLVLQVAYNLSSPLPDTFPLLDQVTSAKPPIAPRICRHDCRFEPPTSWSRTFGHPSL